MRLIILCLNLFFLQAQTSYINIDSNELENNFNKIFVNNNNEMYLLNTDNSNLVYKVNNKINNNISGFGWGKYEFSNPKDIFFYSGKLLVSDYENNRISIFDRQLNYLTQLTIKDKSDFYPTEITVSDKGYIFIINEFIPEIVKFNSQYKTILRFGNINSGKNALEKPKDIISINELIYVLDDSSIITFDEFGNNVTKIDLMIECSGLINYKNNPAVITKNKILTVKKKLIYQTPNEEKIIDVCKLNNRYFILTETKIIEIEIQN